MGVKEWWADLQTPSVQRGNIERDGQVSLDALASMFSFNGLSYGGYGPMQTYSPNREEVASNFEGYVRQAYQSNGVVFACMLARSMVFADVRFMFRALKDGRPGNVFANTDGRQTGSGDLRLLRTPWSGGTTWDLLAEMIQSVDVAGNAFVLRRGGRLRVLRPDWITMVIGVPNNPKATMWDLDAEVLGYIYKEGGPGSQRKSVGLLPEEVAHWAPYPDPLSPFRGMSWLTPVLREIMADSAMTSHKKQYLDQGATVNLGLKFDPSTSIETFHEAVAAFKEGHEGVANAYKTLFLLGADPVPVGSNFQQMDFKTVQGAGETRIAAAAGMHPTLVGLSEGLQGSSLNAGNFGAARRLTGDKTYRPLWRSACGALAQIITVPANSELWYDEQDVAFLREDKADIANIQVAEATAIRQLIDGGYTAESVVDAITADDMTRLKHTGLFSVQLQAPGSTKMPQGEVPGETPVGTGTKPETLDPNQPTDKPPPAVVPGSTVKAPNGLAKAASEDLRIDRMMRVFEMQARNQPDIHLPDITVEAPNITVNVPENPVTVTTPDVHVTTPDIHFTAPDNPVTVNLPKQDMTVNVPDIRVDIPEPKEPEPAPDRRPGRAKLVRDEHGVVEGVEYEYDEPDPAKVRP